MTVKMMKSSSNSTPTKVEKWETANPIINARTNNTLHRNAQTPHESIVLVSSGEVICRGAAALELFELYLWEWNRIRGVV